MGIVSLLREQVVLKTGACKPDVFSFQSLLQKYNECQGKHPVQMCTLHNNDVDSRRIH